MKIFNIIFCLLFILFAALQYNDPDPYVWMPFYLFGAIVCGMAITKKFHPGITIAGIIIYSVYGLYEIFKTDGVIDWVTRHHSENIAETMQAEKPWIESSREFFGLMILILVLAINYIHFKRFQKRV